ncbi:hypothetical protein BDW69DRAFT_19376 [Aspergillus filifer]
MNHRKRNVEGTDMDCCEPLRRCRRCNCTTGSAASASAIMCPTTRACVILFSRPKKRGDQLTTICLLAETCSSSRKLMYRILCRHNTSETRLDRSMDPSCTVTTRSAPSARERVTWVVV